MPLVEDLTHLERQLATLITRYEQYFIGLEKREPLQLLDEVDRIVRRHSNTTITNTMLKHKFNMLTARLNTYREHWNRILRLIEDGRYSRDRFIGDLRRRERVTPRTEEKEGGSVSDSNEIDRLFNEFCEARKSCHLPFESLTREMVAATIEKSKPALVSKLGTDNISFRVIVEDGKPKIKAAPRK